MSAVPKVDVRDLGSVRRAMQSHNNQSSNANDDNVVVIGDDWVAADGLGEKEMQDRRRKRGFITLNRSPLARKIITFNLIAVIILVAGMLYLAPSRDHLAYQRANGLVSEAELIADVFEAHLPGSADDHVGLDANSTLAGLDLRGGIEVFVFDTDGTQVGAATATTSGEVTGLSRDKGGTVITNLLNAGWESLSGIFATNIDPTAQLDTAARAQALALPALGGNTAVETSSDETGGTIFAVATPIMQNGRPVGVVALVSAAGEIDALVRREREQVLQMFVIGILVSIGLSLVLASTIANPLADLAAAAELGRDRNARQMSPHKIRIPDLTARPDEIGRLSAALRGMVAALYERIEGNEQFAADVSHEIKNPLASLRSAVGTLRIAKRDDQRERLLDVIEHDVRRLDRLVSDISNASRLDAELVKEEEETFDLLRTVRRINDHLAKEAESKGIDYITDLPSNKIEFQGLEGRLAQVFVNLITNALSS
ncbi:MAG: sensor histidine kinase, partial [Rhodobacteraceae bacterium]|nr:sensor histidine kinase [Paracoccaceae bacterium]